MFALSEFRYLQCWNALFLAVHQSVKSELDRQSTLHSEAETRVRQADLSLKTMQANSKHLIGDLQGQLDQQVSARVGHHIRRSSSP